MQSPTVLACLAVIASATLPQDSQEPIEPTPERPNVLFILVDDLGYMDIEPNNEGTFYETPNVTRLARGGMRFTQGYAASPVCSPTRYSVQTGKYPTRVDATDYFTGRRALTFAPAPLRDEMPLDELTIAQALKQEGYATYFAGKWHLGKTPEHWPEKRGYDVNKGGHERGGPYGPGRYFTPYGNPRLEDGPEGEHLPERLGRETAQFIAEHAHEPFFAFLSFYSVHTPLMAPKELVEKYQAKAKSLDLNRRTAFAREEQVDPGKKERRVRTLQSHATYAGMVESMDRAVGVVLDALDSAGVADETLVIFFSDNGGLSTSEGSPTSNLPLRGGKGWLYEGGIREPMIVRWPGTTEPGSVCTTPVISTDFYPTILAATGSSPRPSQHLDGLSLTPLLTGGELGERPLFWHYPHYSNQGGFPGAAVRLGSWKLIERFEDGRVHLYDLVEDPEERDDLAATRPEIVEELRGLLHAWYEETDAKFLGARPDGPEPWRPDAERP
jgi:arylsulfatase A-like enzyme